jgi:hypothetical protein
VRFRLVYLSLALYLAAVYAGLLFLPTFPSLAVHNSKVVNDADWGHVRAYDGVIQFIAGPAGDRSYRELPFGRVLFTSAGVAVADDADGTNLHTLESDVARGCLMRAQGSGVVVLIAVGKCVPVWARTDEGGKPAQWIRIQSTRPTPSVIYVKYDPLP